MPPSWLSWLLALLAVLVGCAVWGVTTASASLSLGPHKARYEVALDGRVVIDAGPLGTLEMSSPAPLGLGARITVQEIPDDLTSVDQATTVEALTQDLQAYLQFFSGTEQAISTAVGALIADAVERAVLALLTVTACAAVGYALLGGSRRAELAAALRPRTLPLAAGVVVVAVVAGLSAWQVGRTTRQDAPATAVFAGTALEGTRVTGRLAGVIDTYGRLLMQQYQSNEEYYAQASESLAQAWQARREAEQAQRTVSAWAPDDGSGLAGAGDVSEPSGGEPSGVAPTGGGDVEAGSGDVAAGAGDAAAGRDVDPGPAGRRADTPSPDEGGAGRADPAGDPADGEQDDELVTMLLVSDIHCNVGMKAVIRRAAELSGARLVVNAGDTTMTGTVVENVCVDAVSDAVPRGATLVVADGNHDSRIVSARERSRGAVVMDGDVVEVAGVRFLGDRDPAESRLGSGTSLATSETPSQMGERLAAAACSDPAGVDVLLVHTPRVGDAALEQGCAAVQLSGHTHRRSGPAAFGEGIRYVSGSTAGAASGQPTVGTLRGTAELTVLRFDPRERVFRDYRVLQVRPDGTASVGAALRFPRPADLLGVDDGVDDGAGDVGGPEGEGEDGEGSTPGSPRP